MNRVILIILFGISFVSCKQNLKNTAGDQIKDVIAVEQIVKINSTIYGDYVDDNYNKKSDGFDWVAVSVKQSGVNSISISVRSRADKKKPTCTFDAKANKKSENSFETVKDGKKIIFAFTEDKITISTDNQEDSYLLNFFCYGGATIAGIYKKINENLDAKQIDLTLFSKELNLQEIGFNISSIKKRGINTLSIITFGLKGYDYNETFNIEGEHVINAEVEDINSDGSPELFVYTQTMGSGSYGNVYAFSVNNKKSMSQVYFQPTVENEVINTGYMGHDEFSIEENFLVQRFPIYKEKDSNANPTGGARQVSYKLIDGEASRKLVVDKFSEY